MRVLLARRRNWTFDMAHITNIDAALLPELRGLIEQARQHVAKTANSTLTLLYWKVGQRIGRETLRGQRAEYGEQIVVTQENGEEA